GRPPGRPTSTHAQGAHHAAGGCRALIDERHSASVPRRKTGRMPVPLQRVAAAAVAAVVLTLVLGSVAVPASADSCWATYYSSSFDGRSTASGEPYDSTAYTAAHRSLPFGTMLKVTRDDRSVVVKINDRGPYSSA